MDDGAGEAAGQSQVHGWSSYPLSFPSQPPDIKNWFPSYEYESPEVPELPADAAVDNGSETQDPFEHPLSKYSARDGGVALRENCLGEQSEPEVFAGKYLVPVDKGIIEPAPKRKQSLRALFGDGFLDKDQEATAAESHSLLPVQRNALQHLPDFIASLPDTKQRQEGSTEHSKVLVDCDGISSVDTQDSTPADQEVECSKQSVDCDDARLANIDIGEGFAEDAIHQVELPLKFNGANLSATEKSTQDGVEHSIRPVRRNDISLAETEDNSPQEESQHCKLALDGISSVDTQDSTPADQEVECSKQSVDCDDARLANIDIAEDFAEDAIHQVELPLKFNGTNLVAAEENIQDGVEHSIRPVSRNDFSLAETEENSPREESQRCKLALDSKRSQEIVASDGFVAVKRKVQRPDECKMNKIRRHPMGREKENGKLQENNGISEQKVLVQEQTRRPFTDRTNFSEAAPAAPAQEVSRKWKCPRKGKPFVGRPMKQLRLEQWVHRMN
ncbi:unnamed protein product [Urochloa decumbens]|uniref:Uncharacterized protein n=1 Tax=Urochloa decumbens TaxID=240449 RepID=A0ABC9C5H7_9POAL